MKDYERINNRLSGILYKECRDQWDKVMEDGSCQIGPEFLGFVDTYYYLSKIIPKNWTVIDFGCAWAPQAYYFRDHKQYIGVNPGDLIRFHFENTVHIKSTIKEYIDLNKQDSPAFAICNYVPSREVALVKQRYEDMYIFYPKDVKVDIDSLNRLCKKDK